MGVFSLTFKRRLKQYRKDLSVTTRQIQEIAHKAVDSLFDGGSFTFEIGGIEEPQEDDDLWLYTRTIEFKSSIDSIDRERRKWAKIVSVMREACTSGNYKAAPWIMDGDTLDIADEVLNEPVKDEPEVIMDPVDYSDLDLSGLNINGPFFEGIYDRDAQLNVILSALRTAQLSNYNKRFHCLLYGPPGCGKTDMRERIGHALGRENSDYFVFDATNTTAAGAAKKFLSDPVLPPVMMIEEIEKAEGENLRWLLGILDQRAEIRKINARGNRYKKAKVLCIATANDMRKLKGLMGGALASRFANKIFCPRPTRDILAKILRREMKEIPGSKEEWIEEALKYCVDIPENQKRYQNDPREIIPVCLCGADRLLDGSYQRDLDKIRPPKIIEDAA